ncbi:hypothetical protein ACFQX6_57955 [Streptosporangium lutulentum]
MNASMGLTRGCEGSGGALCDLMRTVLPDTFAPLVAGLVAIVLVLLIALIFRKVAHRLITRVVRRASSGRASSPDACAAGSRRPPRGSTRSWPSGAGNGPRPSARCSSTSPRSSSWAPRS